MVPQLLVFCLVCASTASTYRMNLDTSVTPGAPWYVTTETGSTKPETGSYKTKIGIHKQHSGSYRLKSEYKTPDPWSADFGTAEHNPSATWWTNSQETEGPETETRLLDAKDANEWEYLYNPTELDTKDLGQDLLRKQSFGDKVDNSESKPKEKRVLGLYQRHYLRRAVEALRGRPFSKPRKLNFDLGKRSLLRSRAFTRSGTQGSEQDLVKLPAFGRFEPGVLDIDLKSSNSKERKNSCPRILNTDFLGQGQLTTKLGQLVNLRGGQRVFKTSPKSLVWSLDVPMKK